METVSRAVTPLKSLEANMSATIPEAAVPETAATSGANLVSAQPSAINRASVVMGGYVTPSETMSCLITVMPSDVEVQTRYKAMPGSAQRTKVSADSISRGNCNRSPYICTAVMPMAATRVDWVRTRTTAARKRVRLRTKSPVACERAIKVVTALSSPNTAILLARSVFAQATENVPKAAGPRSRATRNVNMPRKFDANVAMVFKKAPRFSSTPVSSTRAGASAVGGATSSATSVGLTDSLRSRSDAWAISALSVMRKSAYATVECSGPPKFSRKASWSRISG